MRRFAILEGYEGKVTLPVRKTAGSAGYDLAAAEAVTILPGKIELVKTGLTAYFPEDEALLLFARSSLAKNWGLMLANSVGLVDSDYAGHHILLPLYNFRNEAVTLVAGERIAQGVFNRYFVTDDDAPGGQRTGGFGSTDSQR